MPWDISDSDNLVTPNDSDLLLFFRSTAQPPFSQSYGDLKSAVNSLADARVAAWARANSRSGRAPLGAITASVLNGQPTWNATSRVLTIPKADGGTVTVTLSQGSSSLPNGVVTAFAVNATRIQWTAQGGSQQTFNFAGIDPYTIAELVTKLGLGTLHSSNRGDLVARKSGADDGFTYIDPNSLDPYTRADLVAKLNLPAESAANRGYIVTRVTDASGGFRLLDPNTLDPYTDAETRAKVDLPTPAQANNGQMLVWDQTNGLYTFQDVPSDGTDGNHGSDGQDGADGDDGDKGWSPIFELVSSGAARYWRLADYVGGEGTKPTLAAAAERFVTASGYGTIAGAIDVRGPQGLQGDQGGTGPEGPKGDKGDQGDQGVQGRYYIRIYKSITSGTVGSEATPSGGRYNPATRALSQIPTGWSTSPSNPGSNEELVFSEFEAEPDRAATYTPTWSAPSPAGGTGPAGAAGADGDDGDRGWSPVIGVEDDGERRVLFLHSYTNGTGNAPTVPPNKYLSREGLVDKSTADDVRGPQGLQGNDGDDGTAVVINPDGVTSGTPARFATIDGVDYVFAAETGGAIDAVDVAMDDKTIPTGTTGIELTLPAAVTTGDIITAIDTGRADFTIADGTYLLHIRAEAAGVGQRALPQIRLRDASDNSELEWTQSQYSRTNSGTMHISLSTPIILSADTEINLFAVHDDTGAPSPNAGAVTVALTNIQLRIIPLGAQRGEMGEQGPAGSGTQFKGPWNATTAYGKADEVTDDDSEGVEQFWKARNVISAGAARPRDNTEWEKIGSAEEATSSGGGGAVELSLWASGVWDESTNGQNAWYKFANASGSSEHIAERAAPEDFFIEVNDNGKLIGIHRDHLPVVEYLSTGTTGAVRLHATGAALDADAADFWLARAATATRFGVDTVAGELMIRSQDQSQHSSDVTFRIYTLTGGGGGGTTVAANPSGTDGNLLTRIAIEGTNYNLDIDEATQLEIETAISRTSPIIWDRDTDYWVTANRTDWGFLVLQNPPIATTAQVLAGIYNQGSPATSTNSLGGNPGYVIARIPDGDVADWEADARIRLTRAGYSVHPTFSFSHSSYDKGSHGGYRFYYFQIPGRYFTAVMQQRDDHPIWSGEVVADQVVAAFNDDATAQLPESAVPGLLDGTVEKIGLRLDEDDAKLEDVYLEPGVDEWSTVDGTVASTLQAWFGRPASDDPANVQSLLDEQTHTRTPTTPSTGVFPEDHGWSGALYFAVPGGTDVSAWRVVLTDSHASFDHITKSVTAAHFESLGNVTNLNYNRDYYKVQGIWPFGDTANFQIATTTRTARWDGDYNSTKLAAAINGLDSAQGAGWLSPRAVAGSGRFAGWSGRYDPSNLTEFGQARLYLRTTDASTVGWVDNRLRIGIVGGARAFLGLNDTAGVIDPQDVFIQVRLAVTRAIQYGWSIQVGRNDWGDSLGGKHQTGGTAGFGIAMLGESLYILGNGQQPGSNFLPNTMGGWTLASGTAANMFSLVNSPSTTQGNSQINLGSANQFTVDNPITIGVESIDNKVRLYWNGEHFATWNWERSYAPFRTGRDAGPIYGVYGAPGNAKMIGGVSVNPDIFVEAMTISHATRDANYPEGFV